MKLLGVKLTNTPLQASAFAVVTALSLGASDAFAHNVTVDGVVETDSIGYVKTGDGKTVISSGGCVGTSDLNDDNKVNACEGIEDEAPAEEVVVEEPVAEAPPPAPVEKIETLTIGRHGLFDTGSDVLTAEGRARINDLIAEMGEFQGVLSIQVAGHTDSRGGEEFNQNLSERRATTVQGMLTQRYPDVPLTVVGFGETQPIDTNNTAAGRARNRRVEVNVDVSQKTFE